MPHRKLQTPCARHRYRSWLHDHGCEQDTWPHFHARCRRCRFEWWQPTLLPDWAPTDPTAEVVA